MTDADDPFAGLEEDLQNHSDNASDGQGQSQSNPPDKRQLNRHDVERSSEVDLGGPAFAFDCTRQDALYARPETWDGFSDVLLEVELALRDYNIRDIPKRELHDAALRVLTGHRDELVEAVIASRRGDDY